MDTEAPFRGSGRRALFVSADLPWPPDGGGQIATLRNLQAISKIYETDLIALADPVSSPDTSQLERMCRRVIVIRVPFTFGRHRIRQLAKASLSLFSRDPYRLVKFRSGELARALAELRSQSDYDIVHFDQFGVAPYWMAGRATSHACHNVESDIYRRAASSGNLALRAWSWLEGRKLRRAEKRLLPRFGVVLALTQEDAELLRSLGARSVRVVPMPAPPLRPARRPPRQPLILSLGTMSWFGVEEGLLWFRREVYPIVRDRLPDVRWELVGPNAGPAIRRLDGSDGISVRGYVDDLEPILDSARVAIVPLRIAGGIRMKLLDLMAGGIPSVSTSLGARGLGFADGEGVFRRDDPVEFAQALTALLTDDRLWLDTASRGRQFLTENHGEARFVHAVESALALAIEGNEEVGSRG